MANNEFNFNNGSFFNEIMTMFEKIKKEEQENNKLNVLILGKTGAGKSTLINTVFGEKVAKTGSGSPITANLNKYEKDGLCIYDSKGLEIKDDKGIDNLKQFIEDQKAKEPSDQIHLVWFCICEANRRIEPQEKELIKFLKSEKFCTILVITKAQQDKDENGCSFKDRLCHNKQLINSHFYRGALKLPYKLELSKIVRPYRLLFFLLLLKQYL